MSPDVCTIKQGLKRQKGAGLPIALFIITVLSLLVLTMADLQDSSSQSVSLQIQSQRAFFAAESGVQLTLARILPGTENAGEVWDRAEAENINGDPPIAFSADGLSGCEADIEVDPVEVTYEGDPMSTVVLVKVTSIGTCGTGTDSAERAVEVRVR